MGCSCSCLRQVHAVPSDALEPEGPQVPEKGQGLERAEAPRAAEPPAQAPPPGLGCLPEPRPAAPSVPAAPVAVEPASPSVPSAPSQPSTPKAPVGGPPVWPAHVRGNPSTCEPLANNGDQPAVLEPDASDEVSAWAWGSGSAFGEPGHVATPIQLQVKGRSLRGLGTAWDQTLLVASSGALWAAGVNGGRSLFEDRPEGPQPVAKVDLLELDGLQVEAAAGGRMHLMAVLEDGEKLLTWGRSNEFGQLGHSQVQPMRIGPRAVALPQPRVQVRQVACGESHSLVLTVAGAVFAFGDGASGVLGQGTQAGSAQPLPVDSGDLRALPVRAIAAGSRHSLALSASGEIVAWGCGLDGRLGLGPNAPDAVLLPRIVPGLAGRVHAIAAGGRHSAALLASQQCLFTGCNAHGQLGQCPSALPGSSAFAALPGTWRAVALGDSHSVLLGRDGVVYSCGRSNQGQLGTGEVGTAASSELRQVKLPPGLDVLGLATGPEHALVLAMAARASQGRRQMEVASPSQLVMSLDGMPHRHGLAASPTVSRSPAPSEAGDALASLEAQAGVCGAAKFGEVGAEMLKGLCSAASAGAPGASPKASCEELLRTLTALFMSPQMMNASFCFPGLERPRLDTDGLVEIFSELWRGDLLSDRQRASLRTAAMQGLQQWGGDPKTWAKDAPSLVHRDQVRGLAVLLLCPLVAEAEDCPDAYALMARLLSLIAALPAEGRGAFSEVVAEDLVRVLRSVLVLRVRRFCDTAVRRATAAKTVPQEVWEGLLVLDMLAHASSLVQQRRQQELLASVAGGDGPVGQRSLRRMVSRISGRGRPEAGGAGEQRVPEGIGDGGGGSPVSGSPPPGAPGFWVPEPPVPPKDFELESLTEGAVPADAEFVLFLQNAHAKVPTTSELLRLRPSDDQVRSFVVHRQLVPAEFLRRVLNVENQYRQQMQHEIGMQDMVRAALARGQLQINSDGSVGGISLDTSKFFFPINVRRERLLEDALEALQDAAPSDLQKPLKVSFIGEQGQDAGGVSREFFRLLGEQLFTLSSNFFDKAVAEESRVLWFDRESPKEPVDFWMLGVVLGLAVYNNLPGLDARFPVCTFKKLRGEPLGLEDLGEVFPAVASSFRTVLLWQPPAGLSSAEADQLFSSTFCLDFSVSYSEAGRPVTKDLVPGGSTVPMTLAKRAEFVKLYCEWALLESVSRQFEPFKKGFSRVCESPLLQAFSGEELSRILMGEADIELEHLRPNTKYEGYTAASQVIFWLWSVLKDLDISQRRRFLSFVTGSDRAPVGGLGELRLVVQRQPLSGPGRRLPTAHTCFNTLLLPEYTSQQQLREALIAAIENCDGFELE